MAKKQSTNNDIVEILDRYHAENSGRLDGIEKQVKYTNGQVRVLNEWKASVIAVEQDRKSRKPEAQSGPNLKDIDWKTLSAIGVAIASALIAIGQYLGNK